MELTKTWERNQGPACHLGRSCVPVGWQVLRLEVGRQLAGLELLEDGAEVCLSQRTVLRLVLYHVFLAGRDPEGWQLLLKGSFK